MASVWVPGTGVRVQSGVYAGFWGEVVGVDASYHLPIQVRITGVETSIRSYEPDHLIVA